MTAVRSGGVLRVVLADDTPEIRMLLRKCFELDGSVEVVGEAANGLEAVDAAEKSQPDVILLDLAMPVMDGLQAMPRIRMCSPRTRIVVLSAFNASKMEERALAAGASAFISKGSGPDAILATLHEIGQDAAETPGTNGHAAAALGTAPAPASPRPPASVEDAYRRKHDLLPLLTHELGNQLTVIQGFAEMLLDGLEALPVETSRQFAEAIVRNSRQMTSLLETVSEVRKLDLGTLELNRVDVDLSDLVRRAVPDLASLLGQRPVSLVLCERAVVRADPMRVRQVLTNLISNAAKFTPPDAAVLMETSPTADGFALAVIDDGPGIPADRQHELFEKFSRLGTTVKGTGIGLYVSRGIARAHGGDLVLVPQERGCRFVLRLPGTETGGDG